MEEVEDLQHLGSTPNLINYLGYENQKDWGFPITPLCIILNEICGVHGKERFKKLIADPLSAHILKKIANARVIKTKKRLEWSKKRLEEALEDLRRLEEIID